MTQARVSIFGDFYVYLKPSAGDQWFYSIGALPGRPEVLSVGATDVPSGPFSSEETALEAARAFLTAGRSPAPETPSSGKSGSAIG